MVLSYPRIGLTGKPGDAAVSAVSAQLVALLQRRGAQVVTGDGFEAADVDLVICIGGDGAFLRAARRYGLAGLPLIGVNLGRLGFLVDISPGELESRLEHMLDVERVEESRSMLAMTVERGGKTISSGVALNDVVLHKSEPGRLLEFSTHIDDKGVTSHRADGIVVATPTGSTAYALSGGGPILHPSMDAMVLVPICPHTLSDRPLVVTGGSRVVLTVGGGIGGAQVSCDGQAGTELVAEDRIIIVRHNRHIRLLHPADYDFFRILREKLHWGRAPEPGETD